MTTKSFSPVVPEMLKPVYNGYCYAPAVIVGDDVYVSGLLGYNADGSVPEDLTQQLVNIFAHLEMILNEAGAGLADVYNLTSYHLGDLKGQMPEFIRVKTQMLGAPHPAWTAIGVAELALPGALVEVTATARLAST